MTVRRRHAGAAVYKLCSLFLQYPDAEIIAAREDLTDEVARLSRSPAASALARFCDWWRLEDPLALEQHYVATFDLDRRCGLYLTYFTDGDKRRRGAALLRLKQLHRAAGLPLAEGELPDFLPAMLEFAAAAPDRDGAIVLREHRPALELLRASLREARSPYGLVLEGVCLAVGKPTSLERTRAGELAADGPPHELVGLEPYGVTSQAPATEARP
jgi:nitrate reductase molybdenum cofactor assembly chaperone NarJ/NarW